MKYIQNKEVFAADLDKEVCIFNPKNGEYINLNQTGSDIWNLIEEMKSVDSLLESLLIKYDEEKELVKSNLIEFLNDGIKNGFITESN